jgi:hypothetical protein
VADFKAAQGEYKYATNIYFLMIKEKQARRD